MHIEYLTQSFTERYKNDDPEARKLTFDAVIQAFP
jgi:hypothetical protein